MRRFAAMCLALVAACGDRGLQDSVTPSRDAVAPRLDVRGPMRGSILTGDQMIEVRGRASDDVELARVMVNDRQVTLDAEGNFSVRFPVGPGITLIHTVATDTAGNSESDTRAVMGGTLVPTNTLVKDAFIASIDGPSLALLGQVASAELTKLDLAATMAGLNPLIDLSVPCVVGARVDLVRATKGAVHATMTPVDGGLDIDATIDDIQVGVKVAYDLGCDKGVTEIGAKVARYHITGVVKIGLDTDGNVAVDTSATQSELEGFQLETDFIPPEVTRIIQAPLGAALQVGIDYAIKKVVPPLLSNLIGGQEQLVPIANSGQVLSISLRPTALSVDPTGLHVTVDSRIYVPGSTGIVYPSSPTGRPSLTGGRPLQFALSDDAVNQVLASLWGSGLLDVNLAVDARDYAGVGVVFDRVEIGMRLPPVVSALPAGGGLKAAVGDVECRFYRKKAGASDELVTRLSISAETTFTTRITNNKLSLVAAEPVVWLDILTDGVTGQNPLAKESIRQLGSFAARQAIGYVTSLATNVPIPSINGVVINNAEVKTDGGYIRVTSDLGVAPQ